MSSATPSGCPTAQTHAASCALVILSPTPTGKEASGVNHVNRNFKQIVVMFNFCNKTEVSYGYFSSKKRITGNKYQIAGGTIGQRHFDIESAVHAAIDQRIH